MNHFLPQAKHANHMRRYCLKRNSLQSMCAVVWCGAVLGGVREKQSGSGGSRVDSVRVAVFIAETKTESQAQAAAATAGEMAVRMKPASPPQSHDVPPSHTTFKHTNKQVIFTYCSELFW